MTHRTKPFPHASDLQSAARALAAGDLVAFPTETVYGLGADAFNLQAVSRVFSVKGRPTDHPLILHVASRGRARELAGDWPEAAESLANRFWPGPLTLVVPKHPDVPLEVTGGQQTVGIRMPAHPVATGLLQAFEDLGGIAVAAPSANLFGAISPTRVQDVWQSLGERLGPDDWLIDGGECQVGLESTIVDCTVWPSRVLRPGMIRPLEAYSEQTKDGVLVPRVSGGLAQHYAPLTALFMVSTQQLWEAVASWLNKHPGQSVVCWSWHPPTADLLAAQRHDQQLTWLAAPLDPRDFGHQLYARLNDWDRQGFSALFVELPPAGEQWEAIRDRLSRASSPVPSGD